VAALDDLRALRGSARLVFGRPPNASVVGGGDERPLRFSPSLSSHTSPYLSPARHSQSIRRNSNSLLLERSSERVLLWSREERTGAGGQKSSADRHGEQFERCVCKTRCQSIACAVVNDGTGPAGALKTDNLTQFRD